jgi:formylglycine-generating enzyme required for sulfatase activity
VQLGVPVERQFDLGSGVKMAMVLIPPGEFMMGSNKDGRAKPVHRVHITKAFYLGKYEVTQSQYAAITGTNPSKFKGSQHPVERVSWDDALAFCDKLGNDFRLPTEAEWEYACRAGTAGDHAGTLKDMAWYDVNSSRQTHEVGRKRPNAWGLYDMHGNVWEWCGDWYGDYATGDVTDPTGATTGSGRVYRGGCWADPPPGSCSSALRPWPSPGGRRYYLGFRLLRTVP